MNKKSTVYDISTIYYTIGRNLKKVYDSKNLIISDSKLSKIEYFSEKIGISPGFLYHLFSGKQVGQTPSLETLLSICNTFEIKFDSLLTPLSSDEYNDFYESETKKLTDKKNTNK